MTDMTIVTSAVLFCTWVSMPVNILKVISHNSISESIVTQTGRKVTYGNQHLY